MAYLLPAEFATKMVDAGEAKIYMSTRDTLIRAFMAGAILALAAVFAITIAVQTGVFLIGAILFPVGFCMLYLMGFDLLTGVFVLTPLAWLANRPGVTPKQILRNWGLVFLGNFAGALTVAFMMSFIFTMGYNVDGGAIATKVAGIGEARTLGYAEHGVAGTNLWPDAQILYQNAGPHLRLVPAPASLRPHRHAQQWLFQWPLKARWISG